MTWSSFKFASEETGLRIGLIEALVRQEVVGSIRVGQRTFVALEALERLLPQARDDGVTPIGEVLDRLMDEVAARTQRAVQ